MLENEKRIIFLKHENELEQMKQLMKIQNEERIQMLQQEETTKINNEDLLST